MALNKRKILEAARKYAQRGAKAKALKEYDKLLTADSRDPKLLLEVGDAYRRWGQNTHAISQYTKVAHQYREEGFDARAVAVFKQIRHLDPKDYGAYVSLAELYQRMGLDSEAVSALQAAADGYRKEGRQHEALDLLRQMAALDPTNTPSRMKVAELLRQEGLDSEAIVEYRAVAQELENQQDMEQLGSVFERILEVMPEDLEALVGLSRNLLKAGELDRAEELALRAFDLNRDIPQLEALIDLYELQGDDARREEFTRELAALYRDRGDEARARDLIQRLPAGEVLPEALLGGDASDVAEPNLTDDELLEEEAFLDVEDEAFSLVTKREEPVGNSPVAGPIDDSADGMERGFVSEPLRGEPDQLMAEANVYLRYGKKDKARGSLEALLAQEPGHVMALEKLGGVYLEQGEGEKAAEAWSKAAEGMRAAGDGDALAEIRRRLSEVDPARAAEIGEVEAPWFGDSSASQGGVAGAIEFEVEDSLDLDEAIEAVAESETEAGLDSVAGGGGAVLDVSVGTELEETSASQSAGAVDDPKSEEISAMDVSPALEDLAASGEFEFEIDPVELEMGLDTAGEALRGEISGEFDFDAGELTAPSSSVGSKYSTTAAARVNEEIDEAIFYLSQSMYVEAEGVLRRVLAIAPEHPGALLRMGELEVALGREVGATLSDALDSDDGSSPAPLAHESDSSMQSELEVDVASASLSPFDATPDGEAAGEIEFDLTLDSSSEVEDQSGVAEAEEASGALSAGGTADRADLLLSGEAADSEDALSMDVAVVEPQGDLAAQETAGAAGSLSSNGMPWVEERLEVEKVSAIEGELASIEADRLRLEPASETTSDESPASLEAGEVQNTTEDDTLDAPGSSEEFVPVPIAEESAEFDEPLVEGSGGGQEGRAEARDDDASFDLREALADVLAEDASPVMAQAEPVAQSMVEDSFDTIFSDFKKGVSATLGQGDFDTRYDLGIAYREMGLYDDAIGEFRLCLDSPARRFDSLHLMGLCARELGRFVDAISHLEQALALPDVRDDQRTGVYFELSVAEEASGDLVRARDSLQRVLELNSGYPGASERMAALETAWTASIGVGEPGQTFGDLSAESMSERDGREPSETFESFDDVLSEAEAALGEAEFVGLGEEPVSAEHERDESAEEPDPNGQSQSGGRKVGRDRISFV